MEIIKARYLRKGTPSGKAYAFLSPVHVEIGDRVRISENAYGVVVETDIPESVVESYKSNLKTILGLMEETENDSKDKS